MTRWWCPVVTSKMSRSCILESLEARHVLAGPIDTLDRLDVTNAYLERYTPAYETPLNWTGSTATCDAGTVNQEATDATLELVNYFRNMSGLQDVTFDPALNAKAQQAALMMHAQYALSHFPGTDWACYTADGAEAAGRSNLYLGVTGPAAITGYIEDPGSNNTAVGHRRWILYPRAQTMGTGSTSLSNALWVIGSFANNPAPEWTSWPPAGYVPKDLVFPRWSLSHATADFSEAVVTMTNDGRSLSLIQHPIANGYGWNTLVWEPSGVDVGSFGEDGQFSITVEGIEINGQTQTYQYDVMAIDPQAPQLTIELASDSISEASGEHADFITVTRRFADTSQPLQISITSSDESEAYVDSPMTIPAGEASVMLPLHAINDPLVDGPQQVVIDVSADGLGAASATLTVEDNDTEGTPWPWTNPDNHLDSNGDGQVTPLDALVIINYLNRGGPVVLPEIETVPDVFYDVDTNYLVTPFDALAIINYLNRQPGLDGPDTGPEGEGPARQQPAASNGWRFRSSSVAAFAADKRARDDDLLVARSKKELLTAIDLYFGLF